MHPKFLRCKRISLSAFLAITLTVVSACGGPDTLVDGDVAFVDVTVLPMDNHDLLERQTVIVDAGRIVAVGSVDEIGPEEGVQVIDGDGFYLMPGLTEMHAHLPSSRMSDIDIRNELFLYIANGVTTVRAMHGDPSQFDLRRQIESGLVTGPQLYLASVPISGDDVETSEIAEQRVREYLVSGYDLVKVHEGLSPEVFDAVARTAAGFEILFGGHVSDVVGLRYALASGQSSIDHLDNYVQALVPIDLWPDPQAGAVALREMVDNVDESLLPDLVRATATAGAWMVPTMVSWETALLNNRVLSEVLSVHPEVRYMPPETIHRWKQAVDDKLGEASVETNERIAELRRQVLLALHDGGVNIAIGTDSTKFFSVPGFSMHHEMAFYIDLGMTPYDVLEAGTRNPAEYFAATDDFGTVVEGRRADLLLLAANPLDDIGNVAKRVGVMAHGRWFPEEEIQRRLEEIALFYGN